MGALTRSFGRLPDWLQPNVKMQNRIDMQARIWSTAIIPGHRFVFLANGCWIHISGGSFLLLAQANLCFLSKQAKMWDEQRSCCGCTFLMQRQSFPVCQSKQKFSASTTNGNLCDCGDLFKKIE